MLLTAKSWNSPSIAHYMKLLGDLSDEMNNSNVTQFCAVSENGWGGAVL